MNERRRHAPGNDLKTRPHKQEDNKIDHRVWHDRVLPLESLSKKETKRAMHRSETDVLKTCMKREESFVKILGKRAAMNAYRVHRTDSERCTLMITESPTACHQSNESKKAETKTEKPRVKVSNSLTDLFYTLKSEGVIVQTALGPDGSFRIGPNGSCRASSSSHTWFNTQLTGPSAHELKGQSKEQGVLRLLQMCSSAASFCSRPTIMVLKSILMMLLTLLNLTSLFPKSDNELLKDKINSRVQLTTSMKEDDPDIWYELDEWISMYFAYLLHFTIFIFSLLAYYYFM
jgi:hypothetical protein